MRRAGGLSVLRTRRGAWVEPLEAAAAARTRSRKRTGGSTSSTTRGNAVTARCKRAAVSRQEAHPSTCAWTSSASPRSSAPNTHAATLLSSPSWSDIDQASTAKVRAELLEGEPHAALHRAERHSSHVRDLGLRVPAKVRKLNRLALLGRKTR